MTEVIVRASRPKVPMDEASGLLQELTDRIDAGEELSTALVTVFNETRLDLAEAVDRRIAFDTWIKGAIVTTKKAKNAYALRMKRLKMMHKAFVEHTKLTILAHPDLPYRGELGRISVQKNAAKLLLAFGKSAITPDMIRTFGIDESYLKAEVVYSIDTDKVKADLKAGKEILWAAVTKGTQVRFKK